MAGARCDAQVSIGLLLGLEEGFVACRCCGGRNGDGTADDRAVRFSCSVKVQRRVGMVR